MGEFDKLLSKKLKKINPVKRYCILSYVFVQTLFGYLFNRVKQHEELINWVKSQPIKFQLTVVNYIKHKK